MNKIVVITGASSGIGEALAKLYIKNGDRVYGLSRSCPEYLKYYIQCDVTDELQIKVAIDKIMEQEGKIDILINNAGVGISGATELLSMDKVKEVMDINVTGTMNMIRHALPILSEDAKIINISSVSAFFPAPFRTVYSMAKSAVNMLTYGLRMELADTKIQVCAICPAETKTNFTKNRIKEFETNERYNDRIKNAAQSIDGKESTRMRVDFVGQKIFNKIKKKKLKPFYIIGTKFVWLYFFSRFTPKNLLLKTTNKHFGGYKIK